MSAFNDVRCEKCGARIGWMGEPIQQPPCPSCKYRPSIAELQKFQDILDNAERSILKRLAEEKDAGS